MNQRAARGMKGRAHVAVAVLLLLTVFYNLFVWGGLLLHPQMGPVAEDATRRELALAGVYAPLGRWAVQLAGLGPSAASFAGDRFEAVESSLMHNPQAAMETLVAGMPASVSLAYYGAPVLLPLFALLWWRRPRGLNVIARR